MAIDLMTGEHYCIGLYLGNGCESCRRKYPHIKPLPEGERTRFLEAGVAVLSGAIEAAAENGGKVQSSDVERITAVTHPDRLNADGSVPMLEHDGVFVTARQFYNLVVGKVKGITGR